jgi:hypothetical protein
MMASSPAVINAFFNGLMTVINSNADVATAKLDLLQRTFTETLNEVSKIIIDVATTDDLTRINELSELMEESRQHQIKTNELIVTVSEIIRNAQNINERRRHIATLE